jgi:hypothetical protein
MAGRRILEYLRSIELPKETRRSVRASVKHDKRGFVLGYVICYSQGWVSSSATLEHPELAKMLCSYIRKKFPALVFTSIMVNEGRSALHVDKSNCDLSAIVSFGDHEGGELWQYPGKILSIRNRPKLCHGSLPHITLPYEGERYSIVYYNLFKNDSRRPDRKTVSFLDQLGFHRLTNRPERTMPPRTDLLPDAARILRRELGLTSSFIGDYSNKTIPTQQDKRNSSRHGRRIQGT